MVEVALSAASGEFGEARITTDLQGLTDREDVVAEMTRSVILFIQDLQNPS